MEDFEMDDNDYDISWEEARPFGDALTFEENLLAQEGHDEYYDVDEIRDEESYINEDTYQPDDAPWDR